MNLFFDTSALVKYFYVELGTEKVENLIQNPQNTIWLSELAKIEFVSALHRRFRMREIDETQLSQAIEGFENTLTDFQIVPLNALVIQDTEKWIKEVGKQHPIRTLDALHFCSFRLLATENWHFVGVDLAFLQVVRSLGYSVINPMEN